MKIDFLKIISLSFLILFTFGSLNTLVKATGPLDVAINEIAWMGTQASYHDEWIELYNSTDSAIKLDGWRLATQDGTPEINLTGTVPANSYYLLERTDDTTLPDITANQIYTGALENNGEYLKLFDTQDNLIDEVNCSEDWPVGDNSTKQTMERINSGFPTCDPANWQTSQNSGGTPKNQNSTGQPPGPICEPTEEICDGIDNDCDDLIDEDLGLTTCGIGACEVTIESCIDGVTQACTPGTPTNEICDQIDNDCDGQIDEDGVCEMPEPATEPQPTEEPQAIPPVYPTGIFINEFLPSPEGPDAEGEWIEFYNSNTILIDLSGWSIEDTQGSTKSYTFSDDTAITGYGFLVLGRPTSKIVLNNDEEGLVLKNPLGELVNSVNYDGKAPEGQSYARKINGTWQWTLELTPREENRFPILTETEAEAEIESEPQSSSAKSSEDKPEPQPELEVEPSSIPASAEATADKGTTEGKPTTYPSGIIINEILPSPDGPDKENEWIEIFNQNSFEVNLSDWQIQDMKGKIRTYTFSQETKINPQGFLILPRPTTKITLNNDGDGLNLVQPNDNVVDQVIYDKAPLNSSYSRTRSGWAWSNILTPGSENIVPSNTSQRVKENEGSYSKISDKGLAAVGKQLPKAPRSLFVLLVAAVIAAFSGVIVLVLKNKIKLS